ncbi:MAG: TIGR03905 family TSCPD domain-containing protein [Bacteroidales bacterium]|nr:TIGR03905 family TSCPD domain-containing protein [Bacteroidales bacterium]
MANQNAYAAGQEPVKSEEKIEKGDTFKIISDTKENGVRHIVAVPSKKVCSAKIEFDVKKNRIYNLVYTRGCNGNLKAIGVLVEGMKVKDAIAKFQGLECGKRGTSCTDQLAQVLLAL